MSVGARSEILSLSVEQFMSGPAVSDVRSGVHEPGPSDSSGEPLTSSEHAIKRRRMLWTTRPSSEAIMALGPRLYVEESKNSMLVVLQERLLELQIQKEADSVKIASLTQQLIDAQIKYNLLVEQVWQKLEDLDHSGVLLTAQFEHEQRGSRAGATS